MGEAGGEDLSFAHKRFGNEISRNSAKISLDVHVIYAQLLVEVGHIMIRALVSTPHDFGDLICDIN